ncbi:alpha/beta fold hydrolase [Streptomyces sp. NPDC054864]
MTWHLAETFETPDGYVKWASFGKGDPVVLLHGSPFSSYIWREIAPALARTRKVYVWDLLGFGQSEQGEGQDVGLAAQGRIFARLLAHWGLSRPSVVAHDVGGAVALRALLLEGSEYGDLTLVDAVGGGQWGTGYFKLIRENAHVFEQLPTMPTKRWWQATSVTPHTPGTGRACWARTSTRGAARKARRPSTASTASSHSPRRTSSSPSSVGWPCRPASSGAAKTACCLRSSPNTCGRGSRAPP